MRAPFGTLTPRRSLRETPPAPTRLAVGFDNNDADLTAAPSAANFQTGTAIIELNTPTGWTGLGSYGSYDFVASSAYFGPVDLYFKFVTSAASAAGTLDVLVGYSRRDEPSSHRCFGRMLQITTTVPGYHNFDVQDLYIPVNDALFVRVNNLGGGTMNGVMNVRMVARGASLVDAI